MLHIFPDLAEEPYLLSFQEYLEVFFLLVTVLNSYKINISLIFTFIIRGSINQDKHNKHID